MWSLSEKFNTVLTYKIEAYDEQSKISRAMVNKELIQNSKGQPLKEALLVFSIFNCQNVV